MILKQLPLTDYQTTWQAMKAFTHSRDEHTEDEIWVLQHPAVYTLGQQGKREHVLNSRDIPLVQSDRGGQVTYHGPGQLIVYPLINLKRRAMGVRQLVSLLEAVMINTLAVFDIQAVARCDAPGVYVQGKKIGSLGLRIRRGCSYHGLSLNVDMDLKPFLGINPCGMADMQMTQVRSLAPSVTLEACQSILIEQIKSVL